MMTKELRLTLAALLVPAAALAAPVTLEQARAQARQVMMQQFPSRARVVSAATPQLAYAPQNAQGLTDFYVFNYGAGGGFAIIAGDDRAVPVLGYSDNGSFDPQTLPCGLTWLLDKYRMEMEYARTHSEAAKTNKMQLADESYTITPKLETHWHQRSPYNDNCPTYVSNSGDTLRCPAGCVALAMSQIMRYHQWPIQPRGINRYTCHINDASEATNFYVDFSGYTIPWDNMLNSYENGVGSAEQRKQIADFMSRIGRSIDMSYGSSSGAYSYMAANALHQFFLYNPKMLYLLKSRCSNAQQWEEMIISELKEGYPVYYEGRDYNHDEKQKLGSSSDNDAGVGHAFVIDGMRHIKNNANYFHINWGWGDGYDGYCLLSALTVGDYNWSNNEGAIFYIRPAKNEEFAPTVGTAICEPEVTTAQSGSSVSFHLSNATIRGKNTVSPNWGISISNEDDPAIISRSMTTPSYDKSYHRYYAMNWDGYVAIDLAHEQDVFGQHITTPLPDGRYRSHVIWNSEGNTFNDCLLLMSEKDYIPLLIRSGNAQFIEDPTTCSCVLKESFDQSIDGPEIKGDIANWKLTRCNVVNYVDGNKVIRMNVNKTSALQTIDTICHDIDQIELDVYNDGLPARIRYYYSTDGSSWSPFGGEHTIESGEKKRIIENNPLVQGRPIRLMIGMISGSTCLIDNLSIHYTKKRTEEKKRGDVDGNGVVDIDDMNVVINVMLHKAEATPAADVDADGTVDIDDMNTIINVMLHKQ